MISATGLIFFYEISYGPCLFLCIAEIAVKQLQKNPLRPFVIAGVAGAHLPIPVITKTYLIQLCFKGCNVFLCSIRRMLSCLYSILLCGQTKTIKAHRVQYIKPLQPFVTTVNITGDITQRMAHMQTCTTWVREHIQHITFRFSRVVANLVEVIFFPVLLPFFFYPLRASKLVFHWFSFLVASPSNCLKASKALHVLPRLFGDSCTLGFIRQISNYFNK